jgi:hypothetical protein
MVAQNSERVTVRIKFSRRGGSLRRMQEIAVLRRQQKDQAINQPQQLIEKLRKRKRAGLEFLAQRVIGRVRKKAVAKRKQRGFDAVPQAVARGDTFLLAGFAPAFERAVGGELAGGAEPARMYEKPERCEIGKQIGLEDAA